MLPPRTNGIRAIRKRPAMIHACCPGCQLRFISVTAAYLPCCPKCGDQLRQLDRPSEAIGHRLFTFEDDMLSLPDALSVALPFPDPQPMSPVT